MTTGKIPEGRRLRGFSPHIFQSPANRDTGGAHRVRWAAMVSSVSPSWIRIAAVKPRSASFSREAMATARVLTEVVRAAYRFFASMGNTVSFSFPSHTARKTSPSFWYPWRRRERRIHSSSFPA